MKKALKIVIGIGAAILTLIVIIFVAALIDASNDEPSTGSSNEIVQSSETNQEDNWELTVEHDEEYLATREYIWKFLLDKGYEVQTTVGVPNIGKTDADLGENYEGWYAFVKQNDGWAEFSVVLFNGEVSGILPVK